MTAEQRRGPIDPWNNVASTQGRKEATNMANKTINPHFQDDQQDPLGSSLETLVTQAISPGVDRRAFLMRSALVGAMGVITGRRAIAQIPASVSTANNG
jgi:hypothetical protein